jgi:nicotinate-nucleotide adenylyltransferase
VGGAATGAARRIGILGGTFDPPHVAHLVVAIEARDALGLDEVLLVVAGEPWQKVGTRPITPARDRLAMVEAAVRGVEGLRASDVEVVRSGPSYMVDTLAELSAAEPGAELFLVLGSDVAAGLDTWHEPWRLEDLATLVVVARAGQPATVPTGHRFVLLDVPAMELSSSELRQRAAAGRSLRFLVPDGAISVIRAREIYGGGR